MTRYYGHTIIEVEAPDSKLDDLRKRLAQAFQKVVDDSFTQISNVNVEPGQAPNWFVVRMTLEADGARELDDIADAALEATFRLMEKQDASDEMTVLESALAPA